MKPFPTLRPLGLLALLALVVSGPAWSEPDAPPALLSGRSALTILGSEESLALPAGVSLTSIAPAGRHGEWLAAGTAGETRLYLVRGDGDRRQLLKAPRESARTVAEPLVIADERDRLVGLAWLAGFDRSTLAVRFAAWEGDRWGRPVTVAAPGPGSQLALSGAARGGTVVLAWSAFDGQDDEILTSRGSGQRWSAPRRVAPDNAVPDVTPAVSADADGFLVVWSGFDQSEYRLFSSRLAAREGDRWTPPLALGPPGSLFPSLAASPRGGHLLLFREAHQRAWTVLELDRAGRTLGRAHLAAGPDAAPTLVTADTGGVRLVVAGREREIPWEALP